MEATAAASHLDRLSPTEQNVVARIIDELRVPGRTVRQAVQVAGEKGIAEATALGWSPMEQAALAVTFGQIGAQMAVTGRQDQS